MFGIDSGFIALAFLMVVMGAYFVMSEASAQREAKRIDARRDERSGKRR